MLFQPFARKSRYFLECSGFLEQMTCAGKDFELLLATQLRHCSPVQFQNSMIFTAYDEKNRCVNTAKGRSSQIRTATSRDYGSDLLRYLARADQGSCRSGACSDVFDPEALQMTLLASPVISVQSAVRQQLNVK